MKKTNKSKTRKPRQPLRGKGGQANKYSEEKIKEKIHEVVDEVMGLAQKAKKKYEKADEKTKKKVIAGIAGAGALIAGAIGISALKKKRKK